MKKAFKSLHFFEQGSSLSATLNPDNYDRNYMVEPFSTYSEFPQGYDSWQNLPPGLIF